MIIKFVIDPILFIIFLSDLKEYIPKNIKAPKHADEILTIDTQQERKIKHSRDSKRCQLNDNQREENKISSNEQK